MKIFIAVVVWLVASPVLAQSDGTSHQQRPEQGKSMQQLFDEDQADVPTARTTLSQSAAQQHINERELRSRDQDRSPDQWR